MEELEKFWTDRYENEQTGWDIGYPSTPIKTYIDQLEDKEIKIFIPGAGNAYEAEYLWNAGFQNVYVLDIAKPALKAVKERIPAFPQEQLIHGDFFEYENQFDLIFEQTFFCSFLPTRKNREDYAKQMHSLLKKGGKLVGLWFDIPLDLDSEKRPFGGTKNEYLEYFSPYFQNCSINKCYNSIPPRQDKEFFGQFTK